MKTRCEHAEGRADLHSHSTASDGLASPSLVVRRSAAAGLGALALTDHDTVRGLAAAADEAQQLGIEFVPGIELSAAWGASSLHVLGLFIDPANRELIGHEARLRLLREERLAAVAERLGGLGVSLDLAAVHSEAAGAPIGRPHVARALVRSGACAREQEAFSRFIGRGAAAFVPLAAPCFEQVVATIHAAGGLAVLAHPGSSRVDLATLRALAARGLDGLESVHPDQRPRARARYGRWARSLGLVESGGSDDHAAGTERQPLKATVPASWLEALRRRRELSRKVGQRALELASGLVPGQAAC